MKGNDRLGLLELIAIAVGGMVGGGIFTVLGVSVAAVGAYTPVAILVGAGLALMAAYSFVKLGAYFKDEGSTYSFSKLVFPARPFVCSLVGWCVVFGYISTTALYATTFASYALSSTPLVNSVWSHKLVAGAVVGVFVLINLWSARGMGEIEDWMVYTKLVILALISLVLIGQGRVSLPSMMAQQGSVSGWSIMTIAALTFVAYEGFELVINAVGDMRNPDKDIPRSIYWAIFITATIYTVIAIGAVVSIPFDDIIKNKEFALAAGAGDVLGPMGNVLVIFGALLATCSAISGTVYGASRQVSAIAADGYMPGWLARHQRNIPVSAVLCFGGLSFGLILAGNLQVILQFGSLTFLIVSLLVTFANFRMRFRTQSSTPVVVASMLCLMSAACFMLFFEFQHEPLQLLATLVLYVGLGVLAWMFSRQTNRA